MEHRMLYIMGEVFIFDIDGCIMPNIFPTINKLENNNDNLNQENVKTVSKLSLFPEFLEFYKNNCTESLAVYFLTGRKQKYFGKITEKQLIPLKSYKNFKIKYYPEEKAYQLTDYFRWKVKSIKAIINQWNQNCVLFHIYDDLKELFPIISKNISPKIKNYNCQLIQTQADWNYKAKIEP